MNRQAGAIICIRAGARGVGGRDRTGTDSDSACEPGDHCPPLSLLSVVLNCGQKHRLWGRRTWLRLPALLRPAV